MPKKQIAILIVLLALSMSGCSKGDSAPTFETPEQAITHYFEGLTEADAEKILQACAIDEMSENFKFDLYIDWIGCLTVQTLSPSEYPLYLEVNRAQLTDRIFNQVRYFSWSLLSSEEDVGSGKTILMETERTNKFIRDVDPAALAGMEIQKIALSNAKIMSDERYQRTSTKLAEIYGADESTERVVLFSFKSSYYYVGFTLLRYGENWKISYQNSQIANTSALGVPEKTTPQEFESMIGND